MIPLCLISYANDIKRLSIVYEYTSNNPNETPEQARQNAIEKAKISAMEDAFGIDVSSVNAILQQNRSDGKSSTDVFSLQETSTRGEWIETTKQDILTEKFENGFWYIKVRLEGRARSYSSQKADIRFAFINNQHDRENRDQYLNGDDIFLRFSSPVSGSLCVYLIDEEQNVFCLLPYMSTSIGCQHIEANKEYLFFSNAEDRLADEYTLNTQKSVEQNALYVVFSPNMLTKAHDSQSGKNWQDEQLPRQLKYKDFMNWLAKNQTRDNDMIVKKEIITIRK